MKSWLMYGGRRDAARGVGKTRARVAPNATSGREMITTSFFHFSSYSYLNESPIATDINKIAEHPRQDSGEFYILSYSVNIREGITSLAGHRL